MSRLHLTEHNIPSLLMNGEDSTCCTAADLAAMRAVICWTLWLYLSRLPSLNKLKTAGLFGCALTFNRLLGCRYADVVCFIINKTSAVRKSAAVAVITELPLHFSLGILDKEKERGGGGAQCHVYSSATSQFNPSHIGTVEDTPQPPRKIKKIWIKKKNTRVMIIFTLVCGSHDGETFPFPRM